MKVIWSPRAKESLKRTVRYVLLSFGEKPAEKLTKRVLQVEKTLTIYPDIGTIEPLLVNYPKSYRSIVINSINKLVFYVIYDTIIIVAFWDTRREPKALIKDLEDQEKFGEP